MSAGCDLAINVLVLKSQNWEPSILKYTHTRLTALCPGLPGWAGTRKVKPIWILLKQETVSGSGISWAICKSAPRSRQITMPAPHHSLFYRPDALPAAQPTVSKQSSDNIKVQFTIFKNPYCITVSNQNERAYNAQWVTLSFAETKVSNLVWDQKFGVRPN